MSGLKPDARRLLETAARYEELPSRERVGRMRSAVLRRAALGGAIAVAGSTSVWAKAAALGASVVGQVATYAVLGALAGGAVIQVTAPAPRPASTLARTAPVRAANGRGPSVPAATPELAPAPKMADTVDTVVASDREKREMETSDREKSGAPDLPSTAPAPTVPPGSRRAESSASATAARASTAARSEIAMAPAAIEVDPGSPAVMGRPEPTRDALEPQLEVLHRMRLEVTAQRGAEALSLYRANEHLFRGSALEPEARAASIAALCQLGRSDEALRESAALRRSFPHSHLARSLATGCASTDTTEQGH